MRVFLAVVLGAALVVAGCGRSSATPEASVAVEGVVRATTAPVGWMASAISGGLVPVEMLCPEGESPANWRPAPEVIESYQRAKVIAINGAGFERWIRTAPLPGSRIVRSADAIDGELIRVLGEAHSHGPGGYHAHEVIDGHTWIDPINAIAQAGAIERAMATAFPEHAEGFAANSAGVEASLRGVHDRLEGLDTSTVALIAPERPFAYIARRYGWPTVRLSDDLEAWTQELGDRRLAALIGGRERAVVLCASEPDERIEAALIASHGVHLVYWETGARAGGLSYGELLSRNVGRLEAALAGVTP